MSPAHRRSCETRGASRSATGGFVRLRWSPAAPWLGDLGLVAARERPADAAFEDYYPAMKR